MRILFLPLVLLAGTAVSPFAQNASEGDVGLATEIAEAPQAQRGVRGVQRSSSKGLQVRRTQARQPGPRPSEGDRSQPNILILLGDDVGVDMIGAYGEGSDLPATPNIDSLATSGVLFRNAWSQPVCSPTRAGIQTGRYAFRHGIGFVISATGMGLATTEFTIPKMLNEGSSLAYSHAAFGKWHMNNAGSGDLMAPNDAGYDYFSGTMSSLIAPENYTSWTHVVNGVATSETLYEPEVIANEAITWMNAQTKPFFCYLSFNLPHDPYHKPPAHLHNIDFTGVDPDPRVEPRPYYKAMVEAMDTLTGQVLGALDPTKLANTVIIFAGDNGTPSSVTAAPFIPAQAKSTVFEGGVNVPMIVSGPPVAMPGTESAALVHTVDIYATVAEAAGVDYQSEAPNTTFDTISLYPYLANPATTSLRSSIFTEIFYPNGSPPEGPLPSLCPTSSGPAPRPGLAFSVDPDGIICQENIGFGGPGPSRLSVCGRFLHSSSEAKLSIVDGPPNAMGILYTGNGFNPMPFGLFGDGTLVPSPGPFFATPMIVTDSQGNYEQALPHQFGLELVYFQAVMVDLQYQSGFSISNAVRVRSYAHSGAIRNTQYKLIYDGYTCTESFYDLATDPFEQTDLLQGTLGLNEQLNYTQLKTQLNALLNS